MLLVATATVSEGWALCGPGRTPRGMGERGADRSGAVLRLSGFVTGTGDSSGLPGGSRPPEVPGTEWLWAANMTALRRVAGGNVGAWVGSNRREAGLRNGYDDAEWATQYCVGGAGSPSVDSESASTREGAEDTVLAAKGGGAGIDIRAPRGTVELAADGAGFNADRRVGLRLSATDDVGVTDMCISVRQRCSRLVPYRMLHVVNVPRGAGTHTLSAWFRDAAGNVSAPATVQFAIDGKSPEVGVLDGETSPGTVELSWSGFTDEDSGIHHYVLVGQSGYIVPRCTRDSEVFGEGAATEYAL